MLNGFWDEAIEACALAQKLKPEHQEAYVLEARACGLDKEGKHVEATELRFVKETLHGKWYGTLRYFGERFAELGAHDRAWSLYNEAAGLAVKEGHSPHSVRQKMAKLLLKEGKPHTAVEILVDGICEAEQFADSLPKALVSDLRKMLKASGINLRLKRFHGLVDEIIAACKTKGRQTAIGIFYDHLEKQS